jgi:hypothetical protein
MAENPRESDGYKAERVIPATGGIVSEEEGDLTVPDNGYTIGMDVAKTGSDRTAITLRLDVDVSDALTGLKALRREADRAVAALKALEEALRTRNFRRDEYVLWEGELHRVICADEDTAVLAPSRHYPEEGRTNTDYTKLFAVSNRPELYETIADRVTRVDDDLPIRPEVSE